MMSTVTRKAARSFLDFDEAVEDQAVEDAGRRLSIFPAQMRGTRRAVLNLPGVTRKPRPVQGGCAFRLGAVGLVKATDAKDEAVWIRERVDVLAFEFHRLRLSRHRVPAACAGEDLFRAGGRARLGGGALTGSRA